MVLNPSKCLKEDYEMGKAHGLSLLRQLTLLTYGSTPLMIPYQFIKVPDPVRAYQKTKSKGDSRVGSGGACFVL